MTTPPLFDAKGMDKAALGVAVFIVLGILSAAILARP